MKLKLFISVLAGLALSVTASAQTKGGGGGAAAGAPSNRNAEEASGVGKYSNFDQTLAHQHGGVYFIGKVAVNGGVLPWDPIPVLVTCNGTPRYNTQTDSKGAFTIQGASQSSEVVPQTTDVKSSSASQLIGCQVRANLAGFQSSIVNINNGTIMDNP